MALDINREINFLRRIPGFGELLGNALLRIQNGANDLAIKLGAAMNSTLPAPNPVNSVNVASNGGNLVHVTITDNTEKQKNLQYFVEHANNPGFAGAYVEHLGASRHRILNLPQGTWYVRGFSQLLGSFPGEKVNFGGVTPTPIVVSSGSNLTLLPSPGSGTAQPDGSEPGFGLGVDLIGKAPGPKRRG